MKKTLLLATASIMAMAATAQTVIAPPTVDEAKAAGYAALWGDYQYGYVLPNETVLTDNADLKVVMNNGSADKPGANVSITGLNTTVFDRAFNIGSAADFGYFEAVYSLEAISSGIKQPYAIFTVDPKIDGELTLYTNRGNKKQTVFVWDRTANEEVGTYVLVSSAQPSDYGKELISKATVGLTAGHSYWVFGSETGSNIYLYEMTYTPVSSENYSVKEFDASKFSTVIVPPTVDEAKTSSYEALWGDYKYGYVMPNGTVVADSDELKVVMDNGSSEKPGANVSITGLNTTVFDRAFNIGSAAGFGFFEAVYSLEAISSGIKQPYAIFTVDAKIGGELTMLTNRGNKKQTIFVWDRTANQEVGTYVLVSSVQPGDAGKELISKATVGLTEGHSYWIFGSETGSNIFMYAMGYNSYKSSNYGYTGDSDTSAITDVIVNEQPQSDVIYNVLGQKVDENYKGLVIKNGKKFIQR
ncbi:hypothetical protein [uncultured Duncaniella sp.]|uniref:hypothetical protein n=1 Tax=uncultured Duncaniella sp. TaxID=2768039 RepID=UPI00262C9705|nr:hypothetical protein [uncultured Duncaniella sp.]